ncbi:ABC transporter permease [Mycobacterium sp. ITM-2016-00316]|uniref:MlaE family ABC transporter permease n=1 Tax=Mycobacterium sp. ITM-2016-00316 TaxID=2099695 RepID=UPI0018EB7CE5|nr:ABC transporter permease [Mycobacterium sp. ITM-2016-00316]WNG83509.1 ABC transporter permease [Mycobacterium sp. ITM-2016-00316]
MVLTSLSVSKPLRGIGGFFGFSLDTAVAIFAPPFAWREFVLQSWFVARVSLLPTLMLSIPFTVLTVFTFNVLLAEFGAADFSGTGAALGAVTQIGPIVTVLVVAGAGATAMCADLGARTIREELDAQRVMGINPIQALVVPRVLAATLVALLLASLVILVGLAGGFVFSVFFQNVTPGAFVAGLTLVTGVGDVVVSLIKATLFGMTAGLIACYMGTTVSGGPAGVGNAVNETVVFSFLALFVINIFMTAVGIKVNL